MSWTDPKNMISLDMKTEGGHDYERLVCGCGLSAQYCVRCCVDYTPMNEEYKRTAEEKDKVLCNTDGCNNRYKFICSACKLVKYCSKDCQTKDWKAHKKMCVKGRNIQINLAVDPQDDRLVDAFPIGTTLTVDTGCRIEPTCKVKAFNFGKGPYADPKVKFNHVKFPGYFDESMCSYTVKFDSGEFETTACSEFHGRWTVIPSDDVDREREREISSIPSSVTSSIIFPEKTTFLLVSGFLFDSNICHFSKACVASLKLQNIPYELFDFDKNRVGLLKKVMSGEFSTVFIIGFGSNGPGVMSEFNVDDLKVALTSWVRSGGRLIMQGEGCISSLINLWFQKEWYSASYERADNKINNGICDVLANVRAKLPKSYYTKGCSLEGVEHRSQLYTYNQNTRCRVALSSIDKGCIAYVGDVNAEDTIIQIIIAIGNNS